MPRMMMIMMMMMMIIIIIYNRELINYSMTGP